MNALVNTRLYLSLSRCFSCTYSDRLPLSLFVALRVRAQTYTRTHTHVCVRMFSISGNLFHFGCVAAVAFAGVAVIVDCRSIYIYINYMDVWKCFMVIVNWLGRSQTIFVVFQFLLYTSCVS